MIASREEFRARRRAAGQTKKRSRDTPFSAMESMRGVLIDTLPLWLKSPQPASSARKTTRLGRAGNVAGSVAASATTGRNISEVSMTRVFLELC